ncbi:hypothetical protein GE09DRAFT_1215091 [Coniochaeta sp. 2T2.1]|nr:hypothetical protein GE09DRAFT_1215091 [Coniochaeta sp. 2T2.1]
MTSASSTALTAAQLGSSALATVGDVSKHRRENPDLSGGRKHDSPSFTSLGFVNVTRGVTVGSSQERKSGGLLKNVATGVGIGVGIGIGLAAGAYLIDRFVKNAEVEEEVDLGGTVLEGEVEA